MSATRDEYSNTRFKLNEAAHFLEQVKISQSDTDVFLYNLSAFLASARSVVWVMRTEFASKNRQTNFETWYSAELANLQSAGFREFIDRRDIVVHRAGNLGRQVSSNIGAQVVMYSGNVQVSLPFQTGLTYRATNLLWLWIFQGNTEPVVDTCDRYFGLLSQMVEDCEKQFQWW